MSNAEESIKGIAMQHGQSYFTLVNNPLNSLEKNIIHKTNDENS